MRSLEVIETLGELGVPITYRKLDYWVRLGLLSPHTDGRRRGGGFPRNFTAGDLEVLHVVAWLYRMGADREHVAAAAEAVRHHPVSSRHHEVLVLSQDLTVVLRVTPAQLHATPEGRFFKPCWVVPLRAFS